MAEAVEIEELKVGDKVTVLHSIPPVIDGSWRGHAMEIKAIDSPYVAVDRHSGNWHDRLKIDTRCFQLARISDEYFDAIARKPKCSPCTAHASVEDSEPDLDNNPDGYDDR